MNKFGITKKYILRRSYFKQYIEKMVLKSGYEFEIRGSWKFNDFHLDYTSDYTYSDLDLLFKDGVIFSREKLVASMEKDLKSVLDIKVSIHTEDHLSQIGIRDSKVKNIFEYLSIYQSSQNKSVYKLNYFKAKTMILLMKEIETNQRYRDIFKSISGQAMSNLYHIKLGFEKDLQDNLIRALVKSRGDHFAKYFFVNCFESIPSNSYTNSISCELDDNCPTISQWLKDHLYKKRSL